jgi:cytochrome c biogenesis protein CcdA
MKYLNSIVIAIAGLGFVGFGASCLFWPDAVLSGVGIVTTSTEAQVEIRAMYGGLELGLGLLLLNCFKPERQHFGVLLSLASYGGLALARLLSMLMLGTSTPFLLFALLWEAVIAALALQALRNQTPST